MKGNVPEIVWRVPPRCRLAHAFRRSRRGDSVCGAPFVTMLLVDDAPADKPRCSRCEKKLYDSLESRKT